VGGAAIQTLEPRTPKQQPSIARILLPHSRRARRVQRFASRFAGTRVRLARELLLLPVEFVVEVFSSLLAATADLQFLNRSRVEDPGARPMLPPV
jgi:hypothetical protein